LNIFSSANGWTVDLIEGKYPSEQQIAIKVLNILNNKKEDEAKKINARKLLINNFDKDKNFEKYIETIRDFTNNER